jgi:hypothetical protein
MNIIHKSFLRFFFRNLSSVVCISTLFVLIGASCQQAGTAPGVPDSRGAALARGTVNPNAIYIYTQQDLADIELDPSDAYILANDITLTGWTPITESTPFTGTFDGNGQTITVESFASLSGRYIGIFAQSAKGENGASFYNLTVNLEAGALTIPSSQYIGGLVGNAVDTTFTDVTINGELNVTYTGPRPPSSTAAKPVQGGYVPSVSVANTTGVSIGGVAGYAARGQFIRATNNATINATATQSTIFVGGVVGFADDSSISSSVNNGAITGDGPGYNTSAGGIAGYIQHTTVNSSSSGGAIFLTGEGGNDDWNNSWQIYAGGLVGYSGGTPDTNARSEIRSSYATGTVTATAPFPYAGGLVGYNYGYSLFDPASRGNGSLVSQSYATGDTIAISQTQLSSTGPYGNIPYAGGLVGYSSITGSLIEDSYAKGNANVSTPGTYAWAGGLVGGNANAAIVDSTYATGNVSNTVGTLVPLYAPQYADPGPAAGGIAGFNYYADPDLKVVAEVNNSVALNKLIDTNNTTQDVVHRVAGNLGNTAGNIGTLSNNLAYEFMTVITNLSPAVGPNLVDGDNTTDAKPAQSVYEGLGWDFNTVWQPFTSGYPKLQWQP